MYNEWLSTPFLVSYARSSQSQEPGPNPINSGTRELASIFYVTGGMIKFGLVAARYEGTGLKT